MADEKKPKIDLKARLGKGAAGGATPPPPGVGGVGMPMPGAPAGVPAPPGEPAPQPAPVMSRAPVPPPPGAPIGPPPGFKAPAVQLDPSNPLAMAAGQAAPVRSAAPPPQPQRIEVDEVTVQEARKGGVKTGLIGGAVFGIVLGVVGFTIGGARETSKGREQSVSHAKSLATDVTAASAQLKTLAEKLEAGRNALAKEHKFPDTLVKDLNAVNVDFDGSKLAGVRFSGFKKETTSGLIEFISGVQATNDRKSAVTNLLTKLQKPISEQLAAAASNKPPAVNFVVLINKDSAKNPFGVLAPLQKPIELSGTMPNEFTATDPLSRSNVTAPKFQSLDKPGAAYVVPKSIEAACPSETSGQIAQLVGQLSKLINDVKGEAAAPGDEIHEPKPGLIERADRLVAELNKVQ